MASLTRPLLLQLSVLAPVPTSGFQIPSDQAGDAGRKTGTSLLVQWDSKFWPLSPIRLSPFTYQSPSTAPHSCPGSLATVSGGDRWSVSTPPSGTSPASRTLNHVYRVLSGRRLGVISVSFFPLLLKSDGFSAGSCVITTCFRSLHWQGYLYCAHLPREGGRTTPSLLWLCLLSLLEQFT